MRKGVKKIEKEKGRKTIKEKREEDNTVMIKIMFVIVLRHINPCGLFKVKSLYIYWPMSLVGRVFASCPEDRGSIFGQVILKTKKNGT